MKYLEHLTPSPGKHRDLHKSYRHHSGREQREGWPESSAQGCEKSVCRMGKAYAVPINILW